MRAEAVTWLVVIFGLISLITAQSLTDREIRKHFYKDSSEPEQTQENSGNQFREEVEELDLRPKRLLKGERKENNLDPDWMKRFYNEKEGLEVTTTANELKKSRKCKSRKTTTEKPRATTVKRTTVAHPQTTTTVRPRTTTTTCPHTTTTTAITSTRKLRTSKPTTKWNTTSITAETASTTPMGRFWTTPPSTTEIRSTHITPCPSPPHFPLFLVEKPSVLPPASTTTTTTPYPTTTKSHRQPLSFVIPAFFEDADTGNDRDMMKRILRKLNRINPMQPTFQRSPHSSNSRLKKSPTIVLEQTTASQPQQVTGSDYGGETTTKVPRQRMVGVSPAVISYDRARDTRAEPSAADARCQRSQEDREYVRYLRTKLREARRDIRLKKNEPVRC